MSKGSAVLRYLFQPNKWSKPLVGLVFLLAVMVLPLGPNRAEAAILNQASLTLSDPRPSVGDVEYRFEASNVSLEEIMCIRVAFNTSADGSGTKPTGLGVTNVSVSSDSNYVPFLDLWDVNANNTTGVITITDSGGDMPQSSSNRTVILEDITNGSVANQTYFIIFNTYNNINCSSSPVDSVTAAFVYTEGQTVSVTVEAHLSFFVEGRSSGAICNGATANQATTSTTVPLGTPTITTNRIASQNLVVTTNGMEGYTVYTRYSGQPDSGSQTIDDHSGTNASPSAFATPGTEAFGYTTNDSSLGTGTPNRFTSPNNRWAAFTSTNAEVAYHNGPIAEDTTCVGYQVGVSGVTPPGSYTTTVFFTAVPVF